MNTLRTYSILLLCSVSSVRSSQNPLENWDDFKKALTAVSSCISRPASPEHPHGPLHPSMIYPLYNTSDLIHITEATLHDGDTIVVKPVQDIESSGSYLSYFVAGDNVKSEEVPQQGILNHHLSKGTATLLSVHHYNEPPIVEEPIIETFDVEVT